MINQFSKKPNSEKFFNGYTLVELLVVLLIFSILTVLVVQSLALSLRGSRKSENITQVRENVEYAINIMDRILRNAKDINCISQTRLDFVDGSGANTRFECISSGPNDGYIASGSGALRLTSGDIIVDCSTNPVFTCPSPELGVPESVNISVDAKDTNSSGIETASVTSKTKILLRVY